MMTGPRVSSLCFLVGVVKIGLVVYATTPVPDSSERMVAKLAEVSVPK